MDRAEPAERRRALVVANARYDDEGLGRLSSPAQDAAALGRLLENPECCGFEVSTIVDGGSGEVIEAVEGFLTEVDRSDLLLLYFSCHGLKDEYGRLYFAARNTRRNRLRSTAVSAAVVNDLLLASRSRRKVLLLDCCYGGAFAKGMQVKADPAVHTADQFDARGLVVLTASDSTQYAFDGDELRGSATPSRFTAVLVDGLATGGADVDRDGFVTVDDAYEFVRRRLADENVPQSPRKWEFDVAGRIVLARTAAAVSGREPPPAVVTTLPPAPSRTARLPGLAWWLRALGVVAASAIVTWLLTAFLIPMLTDSVKAEYLPNTGELRWSMVALATCWGLAYALVAARTARDAWRPLVAAWEDLLRPAGVRALLAGVVSAVPLNVLLVGGAAVAAGALGYAVSGSEQRDNLFWLAFVILACVGLATFLARARVAGRSN